ncbi:DUF883 family protein [Legionella impletisoli]|uniref:DUF883 domain-containing protein n=1 Tax=Legionella impletisoli TaxID=343510 RepID=A0A917NBR8_9GAMM|nr:DUF883 family protein [Legionella impletisoli]GGI87050.1 hypothetical protein GCM10007966_14680 [Legionella impletisoli]
MATTTKKRSNNTEKAHVAEAANALLHESKKYAHELYEEGVNKVNDAQQQAKEYSDELAEKVKKNPMTSVLIAAGVGFLLSSLLRK